MKAESTKAKQKQIVVKIENHFDRIDPHKHDDCKPAVSAAAVVAAFIGLICLFIKSKENRK